MEEGSTQYVCGRCGFTTIYKSSYISHLKKKKGCPPTMSDIDTQEILDEMSKEYEKKPHSCLYCEKKFTQKNNMYTHMKSCKSKPRKADQPSASPSVVHGEGNVVINGDNNTINQTINQTYFHMNPIEYANTSYITTDVLDELIMIGGKRNGNIDNAILRFVRMVFCNVKHPENYGVYIPNKKERRALVWDGSRWFYQPISDAVVAIRNKACFFLIDHYDENKYNFTLYTQQEWNAFINRQSRDEPSLFVKTDEQIHCELLNNTTKVKAFLKDKEIYSDTTKYIHE